MIARRRSRQTNTLPPTPSNLEGENDYTDALEDKKTPRPGGAFTPSSSGFAILKTNVMTFFQRITYP